MLIILEKLPPLEFLSLFSVAKDISNILEYSDIDTITISLFQAVGPEFKVLMPYNNADSASKYSSYRLKSIEYLQENKIIINFNVSDGNYIFSRDVKITLEREIFKKFYVDMESAYRRRVIDPALRKIVSDSVNDKLIINFDRKRGVFCNIDGKEVFYSRLKPVSKIFKTILFLIEKNEPIKIDKLAKYTKQSTKAVKRSIGRFNEKSKKTFDIKKNLVISSDNGIYSLNLKDFDFV